MKRTLIALALLMQPTSGALAHDAKLHKGEAVSGEVAAVAADSLIVKTKDRERSFVLSPETKVEHGDAAAAAGDLKAGQHVSVFPVKLPGGKTAAKEVVIDPPGGSGEPPHVEDGHAHEHTH